MAPSSRSWAVALAGAALLGLTIFGALAWRSVRVEHADETDAFRRFEEVRREFGSTPLVHWAPGGTLTRMPAQVPRGARPAKLHVLAYRSAEERVIQADVPLWFFKVKGPAADYALRGTGFDLTTLASRPATSSRPAQAWCSTRRGPTAIGCWPGPSSRAISHRSQ